MYKQTCGEPCQPCPTASQDMAGLPQASNYSVPDDNHTAVCGYEVLDGMRGSDQGDVSNRALLFSFRMAGTAGGTCQVSDIDVSQGDWPARTPGHLERCQEICSQHPECGMYGTFRLNFHRFDRFELDLRGHTQVWGAALSCLRLKWADIVLI